jgi:hypothetical protein
MAVFLPEKLKFESELSISKSGVERVLYEICSGFVKKMLSVAFYWQACGSSNYRTLNQKKANNRLIFSHRHPASPIEGEEFCFPPGGPSSIAGRCKGRSGPEAGV